MKEEDTSGRWAGPVVDTNGVLYGPVRTAAPWGSAGCPIAPRSYRALHGGEGAPAELKKLAGNPDLTIGDLDRGFWERVTVKELPKGCSQAVGRNMGRLEVPFAAVALPSGLPMGWVALLPLRTRTLNTVKRVAQIRGEDPLDRSLLVQDVMAWQSFGTGSLLDLLCVLESAEQGGRRPQSMDTDEAEQLFRQRMSEGELRLYDLAGWGLSETDAVTLGDLLSILEGQNIALRELSNLTGLFLWELAEPALHPYQAVDRWVSQLSERERLIFTARRAVSPRSRRTLRELADELGVTRERVRQLDIVLFKRLRSYIASDPGRSISWRIDTISRTAGVAVPVGRMEKLLAPPPNSTDYSAILLQLAGPYTESQGWWVLQSARAADPTPLILNTADEFGIIDMTAAGEHLQGWGLAEELHTDWLLSSGSVREFGGRFVRWNGPPNKKLAFSLSEMGRPASAEKIIEYIGLDLDVRYVKKVISIDDHFIRATRTKWALASWGLPEYRGVAHSIRNLLEQFGPMEIEEIAARLEADFEISRTSTAQYCGQLPALIVETGRVRLRREDEPYKYRGVAVRDARGIFALEEGRVGLLLRVDRDVLRGSGRPLGKTAGAILKVLPNDRLVFHSPEDLPLVVVFPDFSVSGPTLGSIRVLAEAAGAGLGDYLNLVFDRTSLTVEVAATTVEDHDPGWPLVSRLTGIDPESGLDGLAAALQCGPAEAAPALRKRGDGAVADALPFPDPTGPINDQPASTE